ncbi:histone deacetylase HDT1-like [Melia azedarach]|uniref:Histone deacetylase HDT1-like n=1 Tax=Melia azedarach TaxID=155640 RepID=A0ACC1YN70_MELAZ|nr:histone deacetylase HDT1-like [Melia azedarach]
MEFWGVEVKPGQPLKVKPTFDNIIHVSQASLGESKKEKARESVPLFVKFGDQKLVLGTLITDNIPQLSFDLVFEKEFELSHNWKNGSVYFCGYQTPLPQDSSDEFDMEDSEEEEMELPSIPAENAGPKVEKAKAAAPKADAAKPAKPSKDVKPEEDDDSESDDEDDSDDEMLEGDDSDEISGEEGGSDDEDEEDEDSDDDEETPKKAVLGKKRPAESATKTPVSAKKSKTPTTDGKKGGHVATPHPAKQGAKTPNVKTPKSGGQHSCKSCSKTFGSDSALQSHSKAKHAGK